MLIKSRQIKAGIKNHEVPTFDNSAVVGMQKKDDADSYTSPEDYLKQLETLKSKLKTTRESSYQDGLQAGQKAGYQQGVGLIQKEIEQFAGLTESIRSRQEDLIENSEQFVLSFALKVVEKIIGSTEFSTLNFDKDKLQQVVAESLKLFSDSTKYTLHVRRETGDVVEKYKSEILKKIKKPVEISIVEDPNLNMSDCLMESDYGVLDARIESQFKEIKSFFIE